MPPISELNQETIQIFENLDEYQSLSEEQVDHFVASTATERQRLAFSLPIPSIRYYDSASNFNESSSSSTPSEENSFEIDGQIFHFDRSSYEHMNQVTTPIWQKNKITEEEFIEKYTQPYLELNSNDYESMYSATENLNYLLTFQFPPEPASGERGIKYALEKSLYNSLTKPLLESLKEFEEEVRGGLGEHLTQKGAEMDPPYDVTKPLTPTLRTYGDSNLKFLGISVRPDGCIGYSFNESISVLASATGLIEVKTPSFALRSSYEKLIGKTSDPNISFDRFGITKGTGKLLEFQREIRKYTTACVHIGCDRFVITDYDCYVFVHIDRSMSLLSKHKEKYDEKMVNEEKFASDLTLDANDIEEISKEASKKAAKHGIKTASKGIQKASEPVRKNAQKWNKIKGTIISDRDNTDRVPALLVSSTHFKVPRSHRNVRLFFLSFFAMSKERMNDMKAFQKNAVALMNQRKHQIERESSKLVSPSIFAGDDANQQVAQNRKRRAQQASSTLIESDDSFVFDKDLFRDEFKIDLGPICDKLLRVSSFENSQIITINSTRFKAKTSSRHRFYQNDVPDTTALKIFDLLWGETVRLEPGEYRKYTYPDAINLCVNELKTYEELKELMGTYVPKVYGYGRLVDIHVSAGQLYTRFWGPYIQMEHLERDKSFTEDLVTMDFVRGSILPAFHEIHKCGIVHNDFKFSNLVISKDRKVKIVGFANSYLTDDIEMLTNESTSILMHFKRLQAQ